MTTGLSYPRIPTQVAIALLREYDGKSVDELRSYSQAGHLRAYFHASYRHQVGEDKLVRIRDGVEAIACKHGYPDPLRGKDSGAEFDREAAAFLVENMDILPVEAALEEVWSFFTLVLLPHVGLWRFPNEPGNYEYDRLIGKPRNVFRKLWWRAYVLGSDYSSKLGEDMAVGIMERSSIGGNVELARAIVIAFDQVRSESSPVTFGSEFLRVVTLRICAMNAVRGLTFLPSEMLRAEVHTVVVTVRDAFIKASNGGRITSGRELRRRVSTGNFG